MEQMLLGGNDSSSGESDNEDSSKKAAPPPAAAAPPARANVPPPAAPSRAPAPSAPGITDQKQLLKSLYSPANNRPAPQQQQPIPQQQQPPQRQPQQHPQMMPPPQMQQQQQHPMQQPKQQQPPPQQRAPHPGPVQQKPQNLGMMQQQQQQQQQRSRIPAKPMMMPQQQRTSSGMQQPHRSMQQQQPPPQAMMRPTMAPPSRATSDPFEPTPVVHRPPQAPVFQQQPQRPVVQQQRPVVQQQRPIVQQQRPASAQDRQAMEKKAKEKFIVFTRVLMKYLEQKDANLHMQVKDIIKDCAERNKRKEPGYESVTQSMKKRLKQKVPENYWKRAEAYMQHLVNKQKAQANDPNRRVAASSTSGMGATSGSTSSSRPMQQQQQQRGMVSSTGGIKPQVPVSQQQRPPQVQAMSSSSSSMDPKKAQQNRQQIPKTAPPFQPVGQQSKKSSASPSPSASSNKGRSAPKATRRSSDATDTSQTAAAPREYNELLPMVDHAMNYDWTTAGSLLGGTKTQSMLTEEQNKLLNDYRVVLPVQESDPSFFPRDDWGSRNVVSTRVAFARLRCSKQGATTPWTNEDVAEDDPALAIISEGAQMYLKEVLKNALQSARQRQNFDGTRIWYQQQRTSSSTTPPEFSVRLGCDVNRQLALSQANAALTSKRLEEALSRRKEPTHAVNEITSETLDNATSMSDLALTPTLTTATTTLDDVSKRNLQVYGGKDSREPPLGRLPKRPRLEVADFVGGMSFSRRRRGGGQRASSLNSSFFY